MPAKRKAAAPKTDTVTKPATTKRGKRGAAKEADSATAPMDESASNAPTATNGGSAAAASAVSASSGGIVKARSGAVTDAMFHTSGWSADLSLIVSEYAGVTRVFRMGGTYKAYGVYSVETYADGDAGWAVIPQLDTKILRSGAPKEDDKPADGGRSSRGGNAKSKAAQDSDADTRPGVVTAFAFEHGGKQLLGAACFRPGPKHNHYGKGFTELVYADLSHGLLSPNLKWIHDPAILPSMPMGANFVESDCTFVVKNVVHIITKFGMHRLSLNVAVGARKWEFELLEWPKDPPRAFGGPRNDDDEDDRTSFFGGGDQKLTPAERAKKDAKVAAKEERSVLPGSCLAMDECAVVGTRAYFVGGSVFNKSSQCVYFDTVTLKWVRPSPQAMPRLPVRISDHGLCVIGSESNPSLLVVGGSIEGVSGTSKRIFKFTFSEPAAGWVELTPGLINNRYEHSAIGLGDDHTVLAVGGYQYSGDENGDEDKDGSVRYMQLASGPAADGKAEPMATVERYDIRTKKSVVLETRANHPRFRSSLVALIL